MPDGETLEPATPESLLRALGTKYLWWERQRIADVPARRIVAQIMDIGDYEDIEQAIRTLGVGPFIDALRNAQPGWFRPRSWSYWHLRLHLREPGEPSPPIPTRSFA